MAGIDQHYVQHRIEQVVKRLPVVSGRFHDYQSDLFGHQIVPQLYDVLGHGTRNSDQLCERVVSGARDANADLRVALADIQSRAPMVQYFHDLFLREQRLSQQPRLPRPGAVPGKTGQIWSLTLVLEATIHESRGSLPTPGSRAGSKGTKETPA